MVSSNETSIASPVPGTNPLHFIGPPIYAQVSHSMSTQAVEPMRDRPVEKHAECAWKLWLLTPFADTTTSDPLAGVVPAGNLGGGGRRDRTCGSFLTPYTATGVRGL